MERDARESVSIQSAAKSRRRNLVSWYFLTHCIFFYSRQRMFSVHVLSEAKIKRPNLLMHIFKKKNKNRLIHSDVSDYLFPFVLLNIQSIVVIPIRLCTLFPIEESTKVSAFPSHDFRRPLLCCARNASRSFGLHTNIRLTRCFSRVLIKMSLCSR